MYVVNVNQGVLLPLPSTFGDRPDTPAPAATKPAPEADKAAKVLVGNLNQVAHRLEQEGKVEDAAICRNHAKTVEAAAEFVGCGPLPLPSTWD